MAGANAGLSAMGRNPLVIGRDEGYIGVLVDDLVTRCVCIHTHDHLIDASHVDKMHFDIRESKPAKVRESSSRSPA